MEPNNVPDPADVDPPINNRPPVAGTPKPPWDDWQWEDDLRSVDRIVRSLQTAGKLRPRGGSGKVRIDAAHRSSTAPNTAVPVSPSASRRHREPRTRNSLIAWTALSLGLMCLACGGVLLGWSLVTGRSELWNLGLPLALLGQAGLLVGLVLQLENLWQSNRETTHTLDELDEQLLELRHATTLLTTTHSTSAQSFYTHLAEGASPQLMLADLKGQLDLLAVKMAKVSR